MSKYTTNEYVVTLFDYKGTRIGRVSLGNCGLIKAQEYGNEMIKSEACASFSIARNLYNSLDEQNG